MQALIHAPAPWCNTHSWPLAKTPFHRRVFFLLAPFSVPGFYQILLVCIGFSPIPEPWAAGWPRAASAGQTCLHTSLQSCLGSWQWFPKPRQELQLKLHLDQAWGEEKADMSGKKEFYGNSAAGSQTFRMGADFLEAWKRMGSPVSMGNCKCEHSKRSVRLVLICLVRSTSHTRWMLPRTTNSNIFCTLTHGLGLAVARTAGVRGSFGRVRKSNASPKHPGEKQGWLAGVGGLRNQGWPPQPSQQNASLLVLVTYQLQHCMGVRSTSSDLGILETCQEHYEGMHTEDRRKLNKI